MTYTVSSGTLNPTQLNSGFMDGVAFVRSGPYGASGVATSGWNLAFFVCNASVRDECSCRNNCCLLPTFGLATRLIVF